MKKAAPQNQRSSLSQGHFNISLHCLLLCDSVSCLLIATVRFALYRLALGTVMTNADCRIEDDEDFISGEAFSLLDSYACSSIPSESVVSSNFLTPREA